MNKQEHYYSIAGAAKRLGFSRQRLGQLIREGILSRSHVIDVIGEKGEVVYQVITDTEIEKIRSRREAVFRK